MKPWTFANSMLDLGRMYVDLESQWDELLGKLLTIPSLFAL